MKTKRKILCVEDHKDFCTLISHILPDYEIVSAHSVSNAKSLAAGEKFDLYLLDYHLPDGTGLELSRHIKDSDAETPFIFITCTSSMTEKQAKNIGARSLIRKGTQDFIEKLTAEVCEILDK